jgi:acetyltransferase-like isoleucine patch superfamily enzyme
MRDMQSHLEKLRSNAAESALMRDLATESDSEKRVLFTRLGISIAGARAFVRKVLKVIRDPRLAAALVNAQVQIRGKTRVPFSLRLFGRISLRGSGDVEFGQSLTLVGDVVPIELVSHPGARIAIGDHTFIKYGSSISAYKHVKIGRHCLLGHYTLIVDRDEHGVERRELAPPAAPVVVGDHVWIGSRALILPGISIGHHSVIGAGSVVTTRRCSQLSGGWKSCSCCAHVR